MHHQRCVPLDLVASKKPTGGGGGGPDGGGSSTLAPASDAPCPCCAASPVLGLYLLPITLDDLDKAVEFRRKEVAAKSTFTAAFEGPADDVNENGKRDECTSALAASDFLESQAEASYLLLSQAHASSLSLGTDLQRTGRWTQEETAYVDMLLETFDRGQLPLPDGMRLNDFLRDLLLCKSSRLTKKMKHAKLSARCYNLRGEAAGERGFDRQVLSSLEEQFLQSITSDASRLELRFNLTRVWRMLLSNLCLQIGSSLLLADDWIASLESLEHRAVQAEENIRKARRQRMGMALKTDTRTKQDGIFFSGVPVSKPEKKKRKVKNEEDDADGLGDLSFPQIEDATSSVTSDAGSDHSNFVSRMLDLHPHANHDTLDDFHSILSELAEDTGAPSVDVAGTSNRANVESLSTCQIRNNCGPFLDAIASLLESAHLPFDYADVWVPSFENSTSDESQQSIRLNNAGYVARHDVDPLTYSQLNEYGEYSTRFSFAFGVGLPGRVFATGKHSWERHVDDQDPTLFKRCGGAKVYGIKTGFGIAMSTSVIGRIVVAMYSQRDLEEDERVVQVIQDELDKFSPEPKWKLVIDMGDSTGVHAPASSVTLPPQPGAGVNGNDFNAVTNSSGTSMLHVGATEPLSVGSVSTGSLGSNIAADAHEEEQRIAVLLGDHIPMSELTGDGTSSQADLIHQFMSLRLLLLRSPSRRSDTENELIDIVRKSYLGYSRDGRRAHKDIAMLLVKDWQYLNAAAASEDDKKPAARPAPSQQVQNDGAYTSHVLNIPSKAQNDGSYKSHVLSIPSCGTYAPTGAPTRMPTLPSKRKGSFEATLSGAPVRTISRNVSNVNIVDEN